MLVTLARLVSVISVSGETVAFPRRREPNVMWPRASVRVERADGEHRNIMLVATHHDVLSAGAEGVMIVRCVGREDLGESRTEPVNPPRVEPATPAEVISWRRGYAGGRPKGEVPDERRRRALTNVGRLGTMRRKQGGFVE